jgi:hypothetical protein
MYIDCDSRNVFWREKSQDDNTESELEESSPFVPRMTTAIYDDGDCENMKNSENFLCAFAFPKCLVFYCL